MVCPRVLRSVVTTLTAVYLQPPKLNKRWRLPAPRQRGNTSQSESISPRSNLCVIKKGNRVHRRQRNRAKPIDRRGHGTRARARTFMVPASRLTVSASSSALASRPAPGVTRNRDLLHIHSCAWAHVTKLSMAAVATSTRGDSISVADIMR